MTYVVAGLLLVGVIAIVNLLLTFAVIRRLRELPPPSAHSDGPDFAGSVPGVGERPDPFRALDLDGSAVDSTAEPPALIGFFSTGCGACVEQLPTFVRQAAATPGGRPRILAVVNGDGPQVDAFVRDLTPVSRVVVETDQGPITSAFRIEAFPAWCLLDDDGSVRDSGVGLDRLPRLTAA
ncbi:TlpA disulfide reductase family protein [Micromonospora sp. GCM10011542]|uniref:TlpA disulfide reductase family protein n=1 Tax=Micromonospora sp. GCM10011542 TaxID=3317337 RepID=UPI00361BB709